MNPIEALEKRLAEAKEDARRELACLIEESQRELRNLERFDDARMIPATFDLKRHLEEVDSKTWLLEEAYNDLQEAVRDAA